MTLQETRARAVGELIESVRAIESKEGVTRASLDRIKAELIALASRSELFPPAHFTNIPGRPGTIYHLAEDIDGRFALYGSAGVPGKAQPPHNHTTWASIAGVYGDEHNVFYDRVDDGDAPGEGRLKKTHELTIQRGNACAMLPDDFHTIEVTSGSESLHLHLYGKTLEDLPDRITFPSSAGGKFARFMAKPEIYSPRIAPQELRALISAGGELAILDVREEGVHARNHLFLATSAPLSHLELRIGRLVPRLATRIVLVDDDERLAQRAARLLRRLGYRNLDVLAGGIGGWKAAGYELYSGMHVPSKAFGEHVEHHDGTPRIAAAELKAKLDAGEDLVVLDSQADGRIPGDEHPGRARLPGRGTRLPGAPGRAAAGDAGGGELRRPHPLHHRRAVADQRRHPEQGGGAEERHHGLAPGGTGTGARPVAHGANSFGNSSEKSSRGGGKSRQAVWNPENLPCRTKNLSGRKGENHLPLRCPLAGGIRGRPPARLDFGAGRPAGAGDRHLRGSARRAHRARGRPRRARDHDRVLAAADGLARGLCGLRGEL